MKMPNGWRRLQEDLGSFSIVSRPGQALDLLKEMAEALEAVHNNKQRVCIQTYIDLVEPALKKFKAW